jgi:hypothetical protein
MYGAIHCSSQVLVRHKNVIMRPALQLPDGGLAWRNVIMLLFFFIFPKYYFHFNDGALFYFNDSFKEF